jgi:hemerythrin-like domain-containing protein
VTTPGSYTTNTSDMFAVHRALLGALDAAPAAVAKAAVDPERVETIGSFYENVLEFLHVHHSTEDLLLYPLLEERCPDRLAEITQIDDQHKLLDEPMAVGRAAVAAWRAAPSPESAQAVVDALATIDVTLRPHLADEEATVVPLCSLWLSPEEWGRLPGHSMMSFQADKMWIMPGLVMEQLTPEQAAGMVAGMPPEVFTMWTEQWQPAFESFMAEVRR